MALTIGNSKVIYALFVNSETFEQREKWNRNFSLIRSMLGEDASNEECQSVLDKIVERAEDENAFALGDFEHWLLDSGHWKAIDEAVEHAVDDYIRETLPKVVPHTKNGNGELVITIKGSNKTTTKTFQRNGWVRVNIEHEDGTSEEIYEG